MAENFHDNEARHRFELDVEGKTAFVTYRKSPGAITLVHTEVPPDLGGRGLESRLRKSAQADKWSFSLTAGTLCPANQDRQ